MKLLTYYNVRVGMWILDCEENNRLCQIIHIDDYIRSRHPSTRTYTYKIFGGHNCWTSVDKRGFPYEKLIVPDILVIFYKMKYWVRAYIKQITT